MTLSTFPGYALQALVLLLAGVATIRVALYLYRRWPLHLGELPVAGLACLAIVYVMLERLMADPATTTSGFYVANAVLASSVVVAEFRSARRGGRSDAHSP